MNGPIEEIQFTCVASGPLDVLHCGHSLQYYVTTFTHLFQNNRCKMALGVNCESSGGKDKEGP